MPTQNVNLTEQQIEFLKACVASGDYNNVSEVVREALRMLKTQHDEHAAKFVALKAAIQEGWDDYQAGRYRTFQTEDELEALFADIEIQGVERLKSVGDDAAASSD